MLENYKNLDVGYTAYQQRLAQKQGRTSNESRHNAREKSSIVTPKNGNGSFTLVENPKI